MTETNQIEQRLTDVSRAESSKLLKQNMDTFADNVLKLIRQRNISQSDLAHAIDSDRQHLNYILNKRKGITINVAGRIAKALNLKLYELLK